MGGWPPPPLTPIGGTTGTVIAVGARRADQWGFPGVMPRQAPARVHSAREGPPACVTPQAHSVTTNGTRTTQHRPNRSPCRLPALRYTRITYFLGQPAPGARGRLSNVPAYPKTAYHAPRSAVNARLGLAGHQETPDSAIYGLAGGPCHGKREQDRSPL